MDAATGQAQVGNLPDHRARIATRERGALESYVVSSRHSLSRATTSSRLWRHSFPGAPGMTPSNSRSGLPVSGSLAWRPLCKLCSTFAAPQMAV